MFRAGAPTSALPAITDPCHRAYLRASGQVQTAKRGVLRASRGTDGTGRGAICYLLFVRQILERHCSSGKPEVIGLSWNSRDSYRPAAMETVERGWQQWKSLGEEVP